MRSAAHPLPSGRDDTTTQQLVRAGSWMVAVTGTLIAALLLAVLCPAGALAATFTIGMEPAQLEQAGGDLVQALPLPLLANTT